LLSIGAFTVFGHKFLTHQIVPSMKKATIIVAFFFVFRTNNSFLSLHISLEYIPSSEEQLDFI
jgi:hypothetical protein